MMGLEDIVIFKVPWGWRDDSELRVLAVLAEDQSSVPSTYSRPLKTACNSSSRRFDALFWPSREPPHMLQIHRNKNTNTSLIFLNNTYIKIFLNF